MVNYEILQKHIVDFLKSNNIWDKAISLDIEADLGILDNPQKNILSISVARRIDKKIEIKNFISEDESIEGEIKIFNELGDFCEKVRPIILIGYGINRFDRIALGVKMRCLDDLFRKEGRYESCYWALRSALTRSYILDAIDPVRFEIGRHDNAPPKIISLESALAHPRFKGLPFKNTKNIVSSVKGNKWETIRNLWKNDRKKFKKYIEGDVHDTLLLVEDIFGINH